MNGSNVNPLTADELSALCWQMAQLGKAGVPWGECAALLLEDSQPPRLRAALERLREPLSMGEPLSAAMEAAGDYPPYLLRMVAIGQAAGRLDRVLDALSDYYRREAATLDAVSRAVTYPAVMAALIGLVFLVLVARVLPIFSRAFAQMGAGLSPTAAVLLGSGSGVKYAAYALSALLLLCAAALIFFFRGERGLRLLGRGRVAEAIARGRFTSAMALMLQSGLPMDEAMERTGGLLSGSPLAQSFDDCRRRTEEGISFPRAVEESGVLGGLQAGLLSAGFRTGAPEEAMAEIARRCQEEADERLSQLLSRFEYGLVIALCAAVGLVLLSVMLPLLGVLSAVGG